MFGQYVTFLSPSVLSDNMTQHLKYITAIQNA